MQYGRTVIYTDVQEVTYANVSDILRMAMPLHEENSRYIKALFDYEAGDQPLMRKKKYRSDIDCHCVDNVANEVTDFKLSFNWGNPITLVMRKKQNDNSEKIAEAVSFLNDCYEFENYKSKQQELARHVEVGGVGYTYIDINTDYEEGESPFTVDVLDPICTFVVRSSYYPDRRIMLGVTYYCDKSGSKQFSCFSRDARYELSHDYSHKARSGERNPIGLIPITEWVRSHDRMGCFERQLSEMNNLNLLISDFTNDVEQNTQAIWHSNDVDFPKETVEKEDGTTVEVPIRPKANDWLQTYTTPDGKTPAIKPLSIDYDYTGMLNNIITRRALILQKCNVPSRNDNSGGSTGIAMSDATGWTQAEVEATRQDQIKDGCKINEVKIALRAASKCPGFDQEHPLRALKASDVKVSIKRQKTYEMTTKINAYATGVSHGIYYEDMLNAINLFDDPQQVAENSRKTTDEYLKSIFNKTNEAVGGMDEESPNADRLDQDKSDQISNSPKIDGATTE